jgi:hypothetical protein
MVCEKEEATQLLQYTFSSLERCIPLFLMQTVRVIARGEGIASEITPYS